MLAKLRTGFHSHAKGRPGEESHNAVPGSIAEERRGHFIRRRILRAERPHTFDGVRIGLFQIVHRRVQQQRKVRLRDCFLQQNGIHDEGIALGIAIHVFYQDFVNHAAFARPAVVVAHVRGRAENPKADFTGGIASQHGPVLDEDHLQARPRGRDGAAGACQAPSDDRQVRAEMPQVQLATFAGFTAHHHRRTLLNLLCTNSRIMASPDSAQ